MIESNKNRLETILVVEDQEIVLTVVREILEHAGFRVITASSGALAIEAEKHYQGEIHLLLSDVMMPDMSGPGVAKLLKERRPEMRVMLMSGYPDGEMLFLNYGWHFIEKPFLAAELVARVNTVLHTPLRSQGEDHFDTRADMKVRVGSV